MRPFNPGWSGSLRTLSVLCVLPCLLLAMSGARAAEPLPDVVIVVFDELPTVSLQARGGGIDAELFPHFAALAATSTWARGTSTVATRLLESIPAIATGRMPRAEHTLAIRAEYPDNLFTWLAASHDLHVVEEQSLLRPDPRDAAAQAAWLTMVRRDNYRASDQATVFRQFVGEIQARGPRPANARPSFDFIHVTLPFAPWSHTASGARYEPARLTGNLAGVWSEVPFHAEDAWRRHLAEVRLADALLGELVATLKAQNRFDDALVVVTADYGAGFWPGESRRTPAQTEHPEDVLMVPLFVKRPGQAQGAVNDALVQTIDIAPTVASVLGRQPGWSMDGCSIFDAACARPTERLNMRLDGTVEGRRIDAFPADLGARRATLERKLELFPDRAHLESSWPVGRLESWRGREVTTLPWADVAPHQVGRLAVGRGVNDWRHPRGGPRFVGELALAAQSPAAVAGAQPWVALALAGRVEALVPAVLDDRGRLGVQAMLPEARLDSRETRLDAFVVTGADDQAKLWPLELVRQASRRAAADASRPPGPEAPRPPR